MVTRIILPLAVMITVWELVAVYYINDPGTLPGAIATFEQTYTVLTTEDRLGYTAWYHLEQSLVRALVASFIVLLLSVIFGVLMTIKDPIEEGLITVLPFGMTIPSVVIVLLTLIWFNFTSISVIVGVVIAAAPFGIINMWQGARDIDVDLLTMADAFDADQWAVWRHIYIPHLLPYLFGGYRFILAMCWKVTVLGEVFGLSNGLGAAFRFHFDFGNIDMILGYLMIFVAIVLIIEYVILKPLEERLFTWRD